MNLAHGPDWEELVQSTAEKARLERWSEAYGVWIATIQSRYSKNAWEDAQHAWKEFLNFIHKPIWTIMTSDVERYILALNANGLKTNTIRIRLMSLKRFIDFCAQKGIDEEIAKRGNPLDQVEWPKTQESKTMTYLQRPDEKRFLRTICRDPSAIGKRDYAFFLTLLRTGKTVGQIRKLRWGELANDGNQAWLVGKEGDGRENLEVEVWEAILNALRASGRLDTIMSDMVVFAPSKEPLKYEAGNRAEDWVGNRPLSVDQTHYLLKLYAGWSGLKAEEITYYTLRNTSAMRMLEAGENEEAIQVRMGRKTKAETHKYLKRLIQYQKPVRKSKKCLIREYEPIPSRRPGRAQPGNHLNLRHGFYARYLPEMETLEQQGVQWGRWERVIVRSRIVFRRAVVLSREATSLEDCLILLDIAGIQGLRIANAILNKKRDELKGI